MGLNIFKNTAQNQYKPTPLSEVDIENLTLFIPTEHVCNHRSENAELFCDKEGFIVSKNGVIKRVYSYNTDKLFRNASLGNIGKFAALHKIKLTELDNGDYIVEPQIDLKGGGIFGANAGFFLGKFLVHLVAQGGIVVVSVGAGIIAGPQTGIAVAIALEKTVAPVVEAASNVVGLGTGIIGATVTGPV